MSDTKAVLRKLLTDHVGESNAVTQSQLAGATGVNPSTLRSELRRLREERNIPIANQRDGYYVVESREELMDFVGHINSEIESKKQTIEHTLEAFEEFDRENVDIDPDADPEPQAPTYECADCGRDVPRSDVKYPRSGPYEDDPLCSACYGEQLMEGQA
jgi:DNA-binding transcriptional regulator YhcF (GntR family)